MQRSPTYNKPFLIILQFGGPRVQQVDIGRPPNYMALSIFVCLCCCIPIGIAAIITSNEVNLLSLQIVLFVCRTSEVVPTLNI